jgi:N-acetylmuramoyl-L-alanine amidase
VLLTALALTAALAAAPEAIVVTLGSGDRVEWQRGGQPVLLALPRPGEGWLQLAERLAGTRSRAGALRSANPSMPAPLRDVRVRVPWELLSGARRLEAARVLFPADRRVDEGWEHVVVAPFGGEAESWWELAERYCGDGTLYSRLRDANPGSGLFPVTGARVLVPTPYLAVEFRGVRPQGRRTAGTPVGSPARPATPVPTRAGAARTTPVATQPAAVPGVEIGEGEEPAALEYREGAAYYRLRAGEALYSSVVVRFTGQLTAVDVNATALEIARASGIADVTDIPIGYPVRIPLDLLLPEFLPAGDPRRAEWERDRRELGAIRRVIRAANLDGIHIVLDAGHGGGDSGATFGDVWEASYTYDVMARVRRVLQRETKATVWTTVKDTRSDGKPVDRDELPPGRAQRLLVTPPYDLSDPVTGVHLRWVLSNAILQRLTKRKVDPERVAFVSIHADSLHPAVRGLMVYAPSRALRPARGPNPRGVWSCREADEIAAPRFTPKFKARSEALSLQLGGSVVRAARSFAVPVHQYQPVRSSIIRSRSRFVPAVLRNTTVPTAVLIEICNLNNRDDRELVQTWRFREKLAHSIVAGLAEGFSR